MTTTPLPPAKGYTDTGEVRCRCGRPVPVHVCVKDLYTPNEVQQARADLEAQLEMLGKVNRKLVEDYVDLEAENQRLEKFVYLVLDGCLRGRIKSPPIVIEDLEATDLKLISLADAARAALEKQP